VRRVGEAGYSELDFSPSSEWAAYRFDAYREGMRDLELERAPTVEVLRSDAGLDVAVLVDPVPETWGRADQWRIALSAVVEDTGGSLSYWALEHPPGNPDFHHADGFVLEVGAPGAPTITSR
jgi:hypothetical protein